ncbi:MAG: hypothetical protein L3V56_07680, partial [Candidatus Magnetoovum sp. WYHC-5]|nr:hypothetical protein [Candidatus Magnetoovum sp. WYHC-5]
ILIHSFMVSKIGKCFFRRLTSDRFMKLYYRLIFVLISAVLMFSIYFYLNYIPGRVLYSAPLWLKYIMHSIQIGGMLFGMGSLLTLDFFEFFGIRQFNRKNLSSRVLTVYSVDGCGGFRFATTGVYSIIRHPIYFAGILMITFSVCYY